MRTPAALALAGLLALGVAVPASADDVTDQIQEGLKAYQKGDLATAAVALDTASSLIRQQKAGEMEKLLPAPLAGWKADEAESTSSSAAMVFGGGVNATRRYTKEKPDGSELEVTVSVTTDSPFLQTMAMMTSNPMFLGADNKLVIMDGRKVVQNKSENSLQVTVADKILVAVDGGSDTDPEAVKQYFKAINFEAVEKFAKK